MQPGTIRHRQAQNKDHSVKYVSPRRGFPSDYGLRHIRLIQAGMGVGVSNWEMASICARITGNIGTISGVAAEFIVTRTLQDGDPGGHMRRALNAFPYRHIAKWVRHDFFVKDGIPPDQDYKAHPVFSLKPSLKLQQLMIVSEFCLVWLAKEGHKGLISINLLEKIQITHIWYILGAMLAGVNFVTMGAGIILQVPAILDNYTKGQPASYSVGIENPEETKGEDGKLITSRTITFDPEEILGGKLPKMKRPGLIAIVFNPGLAKLLLKRRPGGIQGFVIEYPTAGGHNAPPRGNEKIYDENGELFYDEAIDGRDWVDLQEFREFHKKFGIPFWLAGSYGSPEGYKKARAAGANGVQVGTAFALCEDSGMLPRLRDEVRRQGWLEILKITREETSPTGYPINIAQIEGTMSDILTYYTRDRKCSTCALRRNVLLNEKIVYVCAAEPEAAYINKGGKIEDTVLVLCLCNALLATAGLANHGELPVVTLGKDVSCLKHLMRNEYGSYNAIDVVDYIIPRKWRRRNKWAT